MYSGRGVGGGGGVGGGVGLLGGGGVGVRGGLQQQVYNVHEKFKRFILLN